ncbi:hypothetical protein FACS1894152_5630 [Bacilli bacterium]|nr:hypothetical protein FACS1894152_5630 [Bacilli bacterium]
MSDELTKTSESRVDSQEQLEKLEKKYREKDSELLWEATELYNEFVRKQRVQEQKEQLQRQKEQQEWKEFEEMPTLTPEEQQREQRFSQAISKIDQNIGVRRQRLEQLEQKEREYNQKRQDIEQKRDQDELKLADQSRYNPREYQKNIKLMSEGGKKAVLN